MATIVMIVMLYRRAFLILVGCGVFNYLRAVSEPSTHSTYYFASTIDKKVRRMVIMYSEMFLEEVLVSAGLLVAASITLQVTCG
jgi:hypothetical protein